MVQCDMAGLLRAVGSHDREHMRVLWVESIESVIIPLITDQRVTDYTQVANLGSMCQSVD